MEGPFDAGLLNAEKVLARHVAFWGVEEVALWFATDETLAGMGCNAQDFSRRFRECRVTGRMLAFLHPVCSRNETGFREFLAAIDCAPRERRRIIEALGRVLERQGIAPQNAASYGTSGGLERVSTNTNSKRKRLAAEEAYQAHLRFLPIGISSNNSFQLIGDVWVTTNSSFAAVFRLILADPGRARGYWKRKAQLGAEACGLHCQTGPTPRLSNRDDRQPGLESIARR